jgi:hypothetical protein
VVVRRDDYNCKGVRTCIAAAAIALLCGALPPAAGASTDIQRENALPGTTAWNGPGTSLIEIYASQIGIGAGERIDLHVNTRPAARYRISVYRLGWYGGDGGRLVACAPSCTGDKAGTVQQQVWTDATSGPPLRPNWPVTDTVVAGADWTSGYYAIRAELTSGPEAGRGTTTYVIVREPPTGLGSQILVQVPVNTWEAYNQWGGKSLYDFDGPRAQRVTFDRPWGKYANSPLWWEIQLVRFLEREGYDVSYQTDVDTDADPASLLRHRLVMTAGHDEYWTKTIRDAFDNALAEGTNLAFMGSNTGYGQVRYEDDRRTIVTYKDAVLDPEPDPALKTTMFRQLDPTRPECMIEGVQHRWQPPHQTGPHDYTVVAPPTDPWLADTGLTTGSVITDVVGDEWDALNPWPDACIHPGLTVLLHFADNSPTGDGDAVRFTAPSGARVFASGAQRFSWGLDTFGTQPYGHSAPPNPGLQQLVRNMLDDLTRPQPPPVVYRQRDPGGLRLRTGWPADPRIVSRVVFRLHDNDPPLQICSGHARCVVARATAPGTYRYEAEYVDAWGRTSAPTLSTPWLKHQP